MGVGSFVGLAIASCSKTEPPKSVDGQSGSDSDKTTTNKNAKTEVEKLANSLTPDSFVIVDNSKNEIDKANIKANEVKKENIKLKKEIETNPILEGWEVVLELVSDPQDSNQNNDSIQIKIKFNKDNDSVTSNPITIDGFKSLANSVRSALLSTEEITNQDGSKQSIKLLNLGDSGWKTLEELLGSNSSMVDSSSNMMANQRNSSISLAESNDNSDEYINDAKPVAIDSNSLLVKELFKKKVTSSNIPSNVSLSLEGKVKFENIRKANDSAELILSSAGGEKLKITGSSVADNQQNTRIDIEFDKIVLANVKPSDVVVQVLFGDMNNINRKNSSFNIVKAYSNLISKSGDDESKTGAETDNTSIKVPSKYTELDGGDLGLKIQDKMWIFHPLGLNYDGNSKIENYRVVVNLYFGDTITVTNAYDYNVYVKKIDSKNNQVSTNNGGNQAQKAMSSFVDPSIFTDISPNGNNINEFLKTTGRDINEKLKSWYSLLNGQNLSSQWVNEKNKVGIGNVIAKISDSNAQQKYELDSMKINNYLFIAGIKSGSNDYKFLPRITFVTFAYDDKTNTSSRQ
ncbi:lipoprotein 17-related variable surface protein [Mycoplasma bradburyae]|uniref:Lipoprotein-associated type-17 domain-containing protein n=1 Tax=Mycoplasma bradburyae TaxID=2963128 RepID=A0AAW6HSB7_9MOLU|nr:lipoprotein 17-related variable surface protein [Mycoplasma bradburyae]MDC4183538.1 hypothetical protein [Mycoplasma bradburyae]